MHAASGSHAAEDVGVGTGAGVVLDDDGVYVFTQRDRPVSSSCRKRRKHDFIIPTSSLWVRHDPT